MSYTHPVATKLPQEHWTVQQINQSIPAMVGKQAPRMGVWENLGDLMCTDGNIWPLSILCNLMN